MVNENTVCMCRLRLRTFPPTFHIAKHFHSFDVISTSCKVSTIELRVVACSDGTINNIKSNHDEE